LIGFLGEIHGLKIDLYLHQQGIDTATPAGKAMFQMMGVFAEFERAIIVERVKAGLQRARRAGKQLGRPRVSIEIEKRVAALRATGKGMIKVARELGIRTGTVQRLVSR
jgi:DNA invertase Pin-like site-specific DNA recombinase